MPSWSEPSIFSRGNSSISPTPIRSPAPGPGISGAPNGRAGIGGRQPVAELVLAGRKAAHPGLFWWQRRQSSGSPRLGPGLSPSGLRPHAPGLPGIRRQPGNPHRDGSLPGRSGGLGLARQRVGSDTGVLWRIAGVRRRGGDGDPSHAGRGSSFNRVFLRRWMWVNPGIPFCLWVF